MAGVFHKLFTFLVSFTICFPAILCIPEEITREDLRKLAKANNYLALNLLNKLTSSPGNVFFSPLSLSTAFGMLYYGTKGDTAEELRNALGYKNAELPEELVHEAFKKYLNEILLSQGASNYVLRAANSVLLDKHLDVDPSYVGNVQDHYLASVKAVDFRKESRQIVENVNGWVKENTNGMIKKLLNDLDPSTILVLLNAVYFKGTWKNQFEPRITRQSTFYNDGLESGAKKVPMMKQKYTFPYKRIEGAQVVELPYQGEDISMIVLLPEDRDGLEALERSLTLEKLSSIRQQLSKTEMILMLPKFKVEYSKEMSGEFRSLGANSVFAPGANFSGITTSGNVFVSQVLHKAVIEVNEEGSEAAAVTGIIATRIISRTPQFIVDHPFLFAIVDKRNDMILFLDLSNNKTKQLAATITDELWRSNGRTAGDHARGFSRMVVMSSVLFATILVEDDVQEATESLRGYFKTLTEPFISKTEFGEFLRYLLSRARAVRDVPVVPEATVTRLVNTYSEILEAESELVYQPRTLQDLSRVSVRRYLSQKRCVLPVVVDELPLPFAMKKFVLGDS